MNYQGEKTIKEKSKIVPQRLYILDPLSHDPQRYIYIYIYSNDKDFSYSTSFHICGILYMCSFMSMIYFKVVHFGQ
jgi:hypothetical protein